MKKKYINIVLTFDKLYIVQAGVTAYSIAKNLNKKFTARFFLVTSDIVESDLLLFNKIKNSEFVNLDIKEYLYLLNKIDVSSFRNQYINLVCYYRLLLLEVLPEYVEKFCYVDCDIIVNTDLSIIYEDLDNTRLLSCVEEIFAMQYRESILKHCYKINEFKKFAKEPLKFPYFNAGFFILNFEMAKKEEIFKKYFEFLDRNPNPPFADQDTMNAVIGQNYTEKINYLSPEWNIFCGMDFNLNYDRNNFKPSDIKKAMVNPKIYHFVGSRKPWKNNTHKYFLKWWKYFFKSPFCKDIPLKREFKKLTLKNEKKDIVKIKLFNFIPLLKINIKNNIVRGRLFYLIPIFKTKNKNNTLKIKLFNFIPLLKIKK